MTQNTTTENGTRFANLVMTAIKRGRSVRKIGERNRGQQITLNIAQLYTLVISKDMLKSQKDGDLLVLGRPGNSKNDQPDIVLLGTNGCIDNRISRIQCIIRCVGTGFVIYDCGICGTEFIK